MKKQKASPYSQRKPKDEPNKKLLIWAGSAFGVIIVAMALLIAFNQ